MVKSIKIFCLIIGALLYFCSSFTAECAVVMIDSFTFPATTQTVTSKGQQSFVNVTDTVLGGVRDGSVGCESSDADGTTTGKIDDGKYEILTNKKASPSTYLSYDGTSGWGTNLDTDPFNGQFAQPIDLTDGGLNNSFNITFSSAGGKSPTTNSFNDVLLTVLADGTLYQYDFDDEANEWFDDHYVALASDEPATYSMPFSSLAGADMSQVDAVCLHICSENYDLEYSIDSFYTDVSSSVTVPEPGVAATFLAGGALLWLLRRRGS